MNRTRSARPLTPELSCFGVGFFRKTLSKLTRAGSRTGLADVAQIGVAFSPKTLRLSDTSQPFAGPSLIGLHEHPSLVVSNRQRITLSSSVAAKVQLA